MGHVNARIENEINLQKYNEGHVNPNGDFRFNLNRRRIRNTYKLSQISTPIIR